MHPFDDFPGIVTADEPMAPHLWFRLGGHAAFLARPETLDQMLGLIRRCRAEQIPFKLLAGGSNVLVRDEGTRALVIHLESPAFSDVTIRDRRVVAGAAVPLTKFTSDQIFGYAVSPDQKQVAAVRGRVSSDVVLISSAK